MSICNENIKPIDIEHMSNEIKLYLKASAHKNATDALEVLEYINDMGNVHSHTSLKEIEILRLVWQRITHKINIESIDSIRELLEYSDFPHLKEILLTIS